MGSTFYAIPCKRGGESFLLRTTDKEDQERAILIDAAYGCGDNHSTVFDALQREAPDLQRIDVAVCTHEDQDHSHGFPNLLAQWTADNKKIGELWLPGRWALAFPDAALRPKWSEQQVVKGAFTAATNLEQAILSVLGDDDERPWGDSLIEPLEALLPLHYDLVRLGLEFADRDGDELFVVPISTNPDSEFNWAGLESEHDPVSISNEINAVRGDDFCHLTYARRVEVIVSDLGEDSPKPNTAGGHALAMMLASSVLRTHDLILDIAATALKYRIPVRWFDFDKFIEYGYAAGGDPGLLEPVNSVEVLRTAAKPGAEVFALALTLSQANEESLVFLRPGVHGEPPVLFTADSRLAEGIYSPKSDFPVPSKLSADWPAPIVTAPHHGSKTNEHAYHVVSRWFSSVKPIYVRNGGEHVRHGFAASFLAANPRACVRCGYKDNPRRLIRFEAPAGEWRMPVHPIPCVCT